MSDGMNRAIAATRATQLRPYRVAVFVQLGKRGWSFQAYTRIYNPEWEGCNMVEVEAASGTEANEKAIQVIKAKMDLESMICPAGVNCYGE